MSVIHNPPPDSAPLRMGLIAGNADWPAVLDALRGVARLALVAVAGGSGPPPEGCELFDDTRVMLAQGELRAVLVLASVRVGVEIGNLAAEHGVHILRTGPLARNFGEGADALRRARAAGTVLRVVSDWDHVGEDVRTLARRMDGRPIYSELNVSEPGPSLNSWRSSLVDAGGGAAATSAAPLLEALIGLRGLPESVLAGVARCRRPPGLAPRETEDIAAAVLRFEGGGLASLRALWDQPPDSESQTHHTPDHTLRIARDPNQPADTATDRAELTDARGAVLESRLLPPATLARELSRFATQIADAGGDELASLQERQLALCALLETLYLAARTGQPEQPRKLYEVHRWPEFRR